MVGVGAGRQRVADSRPLRGTELRSLAQPEVDDVPSGNLKAKEQIRPWLRHTAKSNADECSQYERPISPF